MNKFVCYGCDVHPYQDALELAGHILENNNQYHLPYRAWAIRTVNNQLNQALKTGVNKQALDSENRRFTPDNA